MLAKQRIRPLSHSENAKHIDLAVPNQRRLSISLARTQVEIEEAQRLRYKVFAEEMGAQLLGTGGLDVDGFDQYCDHLIVRDSDTNQVIGTYRILSPSAANEAGGYYSAGEFDLSRLSHLFDRTVEVGRACVHQNYRNGGTITISVIAGSSQLTTVSQQPTSTVWSQVQNTIKLTPKGAPGTGISAAISPSLGPCCAEFINHRQELPASFLAFQTRANYFDFWQISRTQLHQH